MEPIRACFSRRNNRNKLWQQCPNIYNSRSVKYDVISSRSPHAIPSQDIFIIILLKYFLSTLSLVLLYSVSYNVNYKYMPSLFRLHFILTVIAVGVAVCLIFSLLLFYFFTFFLLFLFITIVTFCNSFLIFYTRIPLREMLRSLSVLIVSAAAHNVELPEDQTGRLCDCHSTCKGPELVYYCGTGFACTVQP